MKLLVDARVGWGHGIGRVIANTVPRVARLRPDWRIDVLVPTRFAESAEAAFQDQTNIAILLSDIAPFSLAEQTQLHRHARDHDLTWFTNYWVPLGWRGRFVATVHDLLHLLPQYAPASPLKRALARRTFAKVRRDAEAVMFVSRFTEREFRRLIGDPRLGVTVPNGADHINDRSVVPLERRARRLLVVAASKKHKNFALLFDAWRDARVAPHWTLSVISPQEMLLNSVDIADLAGSDARIDVRRGISNSELAALYADTAVLLMPSLYEGFGLPLLEGMRAGALCISSNAGAMVEIAEGGFVQFVNGNDRVGWTIAIEDACAMIDSGIDLKTIIRRNRDCAERFLWDRTAVDTVQVIEGAVSPFPRAG